jgi:hypothetical protein
VALEKAKPTAEEAEDGVLGWRSVSVELRALLLVSLELGFESGLLEVEVEVEEEEEVRASKSEMMIGRPTKSFMKMWGVAIVYGVAVCKCVVNGEGF